ncbi:hypothetical protein, variant [Sphaeroforma arctica JP610]|uniref:Uncharacterized protein n=1 Tax=Sphaeroforma arctica JP610 TaxID=667725 RepID=A0A0L0FMP4_9EUKA|nr:hypothetical protein, variant [Sphaeroforma arctica JP610]KNC78025.1 hypothetical protein, variant [Sphaeroforma arctica JP610]|eukprot:XP_014151927.1 hypothetical protein, variant [Sphaeroforma arctica JP610]
MGDFHSKAQKTTKLIVKAITDYFNSQEKEARIKDEIKERARMRALMEDNEAEYRKLIDEKKDSRLAALLNQTDSYMSTLTDLVQDHQVKERVSRRESEARAAGLTTNKDDIYKEEVEATKGGTGGFGQDSYMAVAHKVTEPVLTQPKMLENGQLKPYQLKGVEWMVSLYNNNLNGILADEMGLGKTIQTIGLISYLIEAKRVNGPYLVAVPLSTLSNWWNEFNKWVPTMKVLRYKGARQERKNLKPQVLQCHYNVLLTTYDFVMKDKATLGKVKWTYLIMDEGHRIKNSDSKLVKVLKNSYHIPHRLLLTGTPLQNSLPELWGLMNFLLPTIFNSGQNFDDWFNEPISATGDKDMTRRRAELHCLQIILLHLHLCTLESHICSLLVYNFSVWGFIRVNIVECKYLVSNTETAQINRNQMVKLMNDNTIKTTGVTNVLMEMRKVCNHPFLVKDCEDNILNQYGNVGDLIWKTSGKFELLDRILPKLRATGHRSLLFSQMTKLLDVLGDYLDWKGIKYLRLDGTTKADDRGEMLAQYNSDESEYEIFLLSTRAGGLGLNLQTADTVLIFDSDWNPHQDLQAQDRAHRIGQKNEVRVLRFVMCNSVEEIMLEAATRKLNMDKRIIQAGRFDQQTTAMERRDILEQVLKSQQHDSDTESESENDEDEQDDEDVERDEQGNVQKNKWSGNSKSVRYHNWDEINDFLARSDEEKAIFEDMDRELQENESIYRITDRFIKKEDIPEVYRKTGAEVRTLLLTKEPEYGRGVREREAVSYDENVSEKDYFSAVDKGISVSEMRERREAKKRRLNPEDAEVEDPFGETPPRVASPDPFGETPPPPEVEEPADEPQIDLQLGSGSESERPPIQKIKIPFKRDRTKKERLKDKDRPKDKDRERSKSRNKDRSKSRDRHESKNKRKDKKESVPDHSGNNSADASETGTENANNGTDYTYNNKYAHSSRRDRSRTSRKRKQASQNSGGEDEYNDHCTPKEMGLIMNYIRRQDHGQLTEAFEVLPSPQDVPGYYDVINDPIALKHVQLPHCLRNVLIPECTHLAKD